MTFYSELFPDDAVLISRIWLKTYGPHDRVAPAGANILRVAALGCGGQGDNEGGGGALARSKVPCTPGENFRSYVGDTQTASTAGDSWVRRVNSSGELLVYADRGRGNRSPGLAANSFGQVKRDGNAAASGVFGKPASDAADFAPLNFAGRPTGNIPVNPGASTPGQGGRQTGVNDENGNYVGNIITPGGFGLVVLEFFNGDPGYV